MAGLPENGEKGRKMGKEAEFKEVRQVKSKLEPKLKSER